jgi:hypothetical protein
VWADPPRQPERRTVIPNSETAASATAGRREPTGDTDTNAQYDIAKMERQAERHRPEPHPPARTASRRDRIAGLMGETAAPALRAAGGYAGKNAAQVRRLARG